MSCLNELPQVGRGNRIADSGNNGTNKERTMKIFQLAMVLVLLTLSSTLWGADDQAAKTPDSPADQGEATEQEQLFQRFQETLSNVKFVGRFTILGKDGPLREEEYTINSVTKLPAGDKWLFNTRIKYGKNDLQVPLPLDVKWAGTTPVITLTDFTVPGLGTFSARVVIYRNKYAGTWSHGEVGGHLFGTIEKNEAGPASDTPDPGQTDTPTTPGKSN